MSEPPTSHENVENGLFSLACGRAESSSVTSSTANRQCSLGTGRPPQRGIATGVDTSPFTGVRSCHIRIPSFSAQRGGQESGARYSAHRHIHRGAPVALADSAVLQVQLQTGFKTDFAAFDSQYRLPRAVHRDQSSLIPLEPEAFIQKALALLRYLEKGMGLMALTGHGPAEISRAKFSLSKKERNSPSPCS